MTNFTSNTYQMKQKFYLLLIKFQGIFQNQKKLRQTSLMAFSLPEAVC